MNYLQIPVILVVLLIAGACANQSADNEAENSEMKWATLDGSSPLVIAHRGASGYLPEHTIEAYDLAIEQGADVIEPDLVFTKDGVLVARHDRYLSTTTNVSDHPEFADRKKPNADPNGEARDDWWVEDFTLAELKTLRARQPFPGRSKEFDDLYEIPTFKEMLSHVSMRAADISRPVGVYPETKHPGYFESIGMDFEEPLLAALDTFDAGPVFIQSFEPEILKRLNGKTDAKLVQLVYEETPGAGPNIPLAEIVEYADGFGPAKDIVFNRAGESAELLTEAHMLSLVVHTWTFRDDVRNENIPYTIEGTVQLNGSNSTVLDHADERSEGNLTMGDLVDEIAQEYELFFSLGIDGVFTDFPDTAVKVRDDK
ncbi:glycerophosphodiester phosphodiesterase family protein [Hyphococcus flavus]|uniref:glycerophosphodiester phosphodiesterase n=1 Tax=Hyphococcus flavus TaxID=1866326 RepID=A0AAF0CGT4_9PROT|nr:glycerophosphodiester phosphodiesterase family protein [Hyphococcus flavus]WDI32608.1 glycerophosphodiester phosphodiesterase family protein [Hyphococcus flavus]